MVDLLHMQEVRRENHHGIQRRKQVHVHVHVLFSCKHNRVVASIEPEQGEGTQILNVPRPKMVLLKSGMSDEFA